MEPDSKFSRYLNTMKAGGLIALVYFLFSIFDSRYALKADVQQPTLDVAVINVKLIEIERQIIETKTTLREVLNELRYNRN